MKKKIFCLLLASVIMMIAAPLTAFADDTPPVPEEYRGSYKGSAYIEWENHDAYFTVTENQVTLSIPDCYYERSFRFCEKNFDFWIFSDIPTGSFQIDFVHAGPSATLYTSAFRQQTIHIDDIKKVSDPTNSTLSTGSDWIIPAAAGVLVLGAVIYIVRRKKERKTE